ncbi:MAG: discoidin domain-containing protein, partial [Prevotella sp.]|nr:discoidin domain-containing protein [Prevotella sp.]
FKELTLTVNNSAWIDRSFWTINTSIVYANGQNYVTDGATGKAEHILDGDTGTFLSLVKPGKSYAAGGSTYVTPADHQLYFIIDMGVAQKFNYIQWAHRAGNSNNYLRVWGIGVYGSNDGTSFTAIKTGIDIPYGSITPPQELPIPSSEYRYVKVTIEKWSDNSGGSKSGSTVQISEFNLGNK